MVGDPQQSLLGRIAAYTEILASDPHSTIFVSLSETYRKMGMLDDALTVARNGLESLSAYAPGHVVLARILCQQGLHDQSEDSFQTAIDLDEHNLAALVGYSRLCLIMGRIEKARELLLNARELSPADSVINKLLLSLPEIPFAPTEPLDLEASALAQIDTVAVETAGTEPFQSVTLAELYLSQGFKAKALDVFKSLLIKNPDNLDLRRRIRHLELVDGASDELSEGPVPALDVNQPKTPSVEKVSYATSDTTGASDVDGVVAEESVLDQLNSLLASIQKRRGDV